MIDPELLRLGSGAVLFLLGLVCFIAGLSIILTREYRDGMKELVTHSARVGRRGVTEQAIAPILDSTSRLLDSVATLVRTAFGMGAFLCLLGVALCLGALWLAGAIF
jgi:hypothetical protein